MQKVILDTHGFLWCLILIVSLSTLNLPILDPVQDTSEMGTVTDLVPPRGVCVTTRRLFP